HGGTLPAYQWKVNRIDTGPDSPVFTYIPSDNDTVYCILTSDLTCTNGNPASSNIKVMTVNPNLPVSISVVASANNICAGTPVTFSATPTYPGTSPSYQWKVNGIDAGTSLPVYSYIPASGDLVSCILNSSEICTTGNPVTSDDIAMIVNPNLQVSVSIGVSQNPVCDGIPVTFTASPIHGGTAPAFQWKLNGTNVGTNNAIYVNALANNDAVSCILTSNLICRVGSPATSDTIIMVISGNPMVTFTTCFDTVTTLNAMPIKLKGGLPLGGTYSGPGVSGGIFNPAVAGTGIKTLTYSYTNAGTCTSGKTKNILVLLPAAFSCGNPFKDLRDNKTYQTIQMGAQCWFAENLNYGTEINPDQHQRDNCISEKYASHPVGLPSNSFYQWDELMQYDQSVSNQGLCPAGWHIPTENDWNILFTQWTNNAFAGSPLKYTGFSGFNALLAGPRFFNKTWNYNGFATYFWSSTAHTPEKAWSHAMNDPDHSVARYPSVRSNAFPVRCVKD
ncbi:MAG TPA: FISUMP domain-containing protein, partial [Bacteroidales bacterium]|nr:FISUMP domain-containing protein [Bacteroidales bacterium]